MGIPRGTTPTLTLTFADQSLDLTTAASVFVTFKTQYGTLTKDDSDASLTIAAKQIDVFLSQEETLAFPAEKIEIQANWVYNDGTRGASDVAYFDFTPQLLESVIS